MIYDLSLDLDRQQYKEQCNHLYEKKCVVELTEKKGQRTLSQNSYLHLILSYFALQQGEDLETVKFDYYKIHVNKDIFVRERTSSSGETFHYVRSTSSLDTKEMTTSIERFRNWSVAELGIYLPSPNEREALNQVQREIQSNLVWATQTPSL
jgi:hypothetical protein|nr:MAG TPA: NinB recombination protein [Caudoviricetes sp.]